MILIDTNVLGRMLDPGAPQHQAAIEALALIHQRAESLTICAQNIVELYAIATRAQNGLGLSPTEALAEIAAIKARFPLLPDVPLHAKWEELVTKYLVTNRLVFDLRLVAAVIVGGCTGILTFNDVDFIRFKEIQVLNPFDLLGLPRI
jgi:predicted nucleic acid-binding protein